MKKLLAAKILIYPSIISKISYISISIVNLNIFLFDCISREIFNNEIDKCDNKRECIAYRCLVVDYMSVTMYRGVNEDAEPRLCTKEYS